MATTWKFYADAGLTTLLASGAFAHAQGAGPHDRLIYFGSTATGQELRAASSPGIDPVTISVTDSAGGSGLATTAVKLALTAGGLPGATGGAALGVGTVLQSGAAGAVPVFVRVDAGAAAAATYTDLGLAALGVIETPV